MDPNFLFDHEGENIPIKISSFYNYTSKIFDVGVGFSNFSSNLVTPFSKKLIPLERLMMPLDGALSLKFNENGVIGNIGFNINSNIEGQIDLSPLVEKNIFLNLVQSSGEIDITNNRLNRKLKRSAVQTNFYSRLRSTSTSKNIFIRFFERFK